METQQIASQMPAIEPQCAPTPSNQKILSDWDFDVGRAYMLLTAVLILPIFLSLSVLSFSLSGLIV